jgi:hypothetical protein
MPSANPPYELLPIPLNLALIAAMPSSMVPEIDIPTPPGSPESGRQIAHAQRLTLISRIKHKLRFATPLKRQIGHLG